ncbi:MAG: dihydrolipoyl dehydrogenase [Planctomycetaceae bacterium]|nr:dihydrolipoyl dehydrogenase [Planctomycetaceae bacterium]
MATEKKSADDSYDLVVIGAGPGGYTAAIRAAQLGMRVACVELDKQLGGTCLRIGCIPSKALLESSELVHQAQHDFAAHGIQAKVSFDLAAMQKRKDGTVDGLTKGIEGLFKKNGITRVLGRGQMLARGEDGTHRVAIAGSDRVLHTTSVLLATGSKVAPLRGVEVDGDRVGTSTEALSWPEVPKHLVVIGAGAIGLELGSVWLRLGAKVTVLEYADRVLPGMDREISKEAKKLFEKQGLEFVLGARVTGAKAAGKGARVEIDGRDPIDADRVLLAVGRVPCTDGLGLDAIELALDDRGRVPIDEHFATSVEGVFAIGDLVQGPMLAHKAEEEGVAAVEYLVNGWCHVDYQAIPNVVYTAPEIASVGRTEEELIAADVPFRAGKFHFLANGRARALGQAKGFVKVLAHRDTDRVLGVHIIGPRAGDLVAEAAVAIAFGASAEDIGRASHAHPTLAEVLKEAALAVHGRAISG